MAHNSNIEYGYRLADTFSASSKPGFFSSFDTAEQGPRRLDVTDIAVNQSFHVEMPKNLSVTSVQGPNVESGVDLAKMRSNVETVRENYLQTDAQIKDVVIEAAHQVMGKEAGDHLMGQLLPKGGPTHGQAAATMIDPTGTIGALWSAANSIQQARNATPPGEMLAQMDKILSHIQEASHKQASGEMDMGTQQQPLKVPQELDFSGVTPEELMGFMQRQVEDDPVMQQTQEAIDALDYFEANQEYAIEHDAEVVTAAKVETAMKSDNERLAELVGGEQEAEIVKTDYTSHAVLFLGENLNNLPRMILDRNHEQQLKVAEDIQKSLEERSATMAPAFNRESELIQAAKVNFNSSPGMAA